MTKLVPVLMASSVSRHIRFKSEGRRMFGTGTFPKRFMSGPYAGILKCDSSSQQNKHGHRQKEVQTAGNPKKDAAQNEPGRFHRNTSSAEGIISSDRHSSLATSPSIMMSTGSATLNSTWRTARREASGWWTCEPS